MSYAAYPHSVVQIDQGHLGIGRAGEYTRVRGACQPGDSFIGRNLTSVTSKDELSSGHPRSLRTVLY